LEGKENAENKINGDLVCPAFMLLSSSWLYGAPFSERWKKKGDYR